MVVSVNVGVVCLLVCCWLVCLFVVAFICCFCFGGVRGGCWVEMSEKKELHSTESHSLTGFNPTEY